MLTVKNFAVRVEARSVAGAIPSFFGVVPSHNAPEMRAYGRAFVQGPMAIPVDGQLLEFLPDQCSGTGWNFSDLIEVSRGRIIGVLNQEVEVLSGEFRSCT